MKRVGEEVRFAYKRAEQLQLVFGSEPEHATGLSCSAIERLYKASRDPTADAHGGAEQKLVAIIHCDQLKSGEPDVEGRFANDSMKLTADLSPTVPVVVARWSKLPARGVGVDGDGSLSTTATCGQVVLDNGDPLGLAPPDRGAGGDG